MKQVTINPSLQSVYNNALHAQFNDHIYGIVNTADAAIIGIPAQLYTEWRASIDIEIDINSDLRANANTQLMTEKDQERDNYITYLFEDIRNQSMRSPFPEKKAAAKHLVLYVDKYTGLQTEANDVETLHIKGLLGDLKEGVNAEYCTAIGINETLSRLEAANNEYENLKGERSNERVNKKMPTGKEARKTTDMLYNQVCKIIEVSYLLSTNDEAQQSIAHLVNQMNQYIAETKTAHHQMGTKTNDEEVE